MIKNKPAGLFTKRLASLLLTQAKGNNYLKSKAPGFKSVGEILTSEEYWQKKERQWRKFNNGRE